jgi:hypothetical protein
MSPPHPEHDETEAIATMHLHRLSLNAIGVYLGPITVKSGPLSLHDRKVTHSKTVGRRSPA